MHRGDREGALDNENSIYGGMVRRLAMEEECKLILEEGKHSIN